MSYPEPRAPVRWSDPMVRCTCGEIARVEDHPDRRVCRCSCGNVATYRRRS